MSTKETILEMLEQNKGGYVSSSAITQSLNVTRNAVWKAVNELRESGYEIDSVPNRGYMLSNDSDIISVQGISVYLKDKSKLQLIAVFDELESTNLTAKLSLIPGISDKRIFIARKQTAGVGHGKSEYDSPDGGIYLSLIADARKESGEYLKASDIGKKAAELIAKETGQKTSVDKKTNGIFIDGKKVCGIMTEYIADLETGERSNYIIGIGIQSVKVNKNRLIACLIDEFIH